MENGPTMEEMVFELHRLTGRGLMTCKRSLTTLIEAIKRKPHNMDIEYELECGWKEKYTRF